jgi:AraC-like DNA-binding protein
VELVFNLADPFEQVDEAGGRHRQPRDLLVGPTIQPTTAVPTGDVDLLGLRFWPGRTSGFLRAPMWTLTDQLISMSSVLSGADRLLDELGGLRADKRLDHLATVFAGRARMSAPRVSNAVAQSLDAIERNRGTVSIRMLSSMTGVSRRHLERQFRPRGGARRQTGRADRPCPSRAAGDEDTSVVQRRRHRRALRVHRSGASHSRVP